MSKPAPDEDDPVECDLPGCTNAVPFEPDEEEWPPEPPPGDWVSVLVARNGARKVTRTYCSPAHAAEGLRSHLPTPVPDIDDPYPWWQNLLGSTAALALIGCFCLGVGTAAYLLLQGFGWLGHHL